MVPGTCLRFRPGLLLLRRLLRLLLLLLLLLLLFRERKHHAHAEQLLLLLRLLLRLHSRELLLMALQRICCVIRSGWSVEPKSRKDGPRKQGAVTRWNRPREGKSLDQCGRRLLHAPPRDQHGERGPRRPRTAELPGFFSRINIYDASRVCEMMTSEISQ